MKGNVFKKRSNAVTFCQIVSRNIMHIVQR
jgi:hypothetical protein